MSCETIEQSVEEGVKGGCTVIQLREKDCTSREFYELAVRVKKITDKYNVPLIINDRLDIAQAVDCAEIKRVVNFRFVHFFTLLSFIIK